MPIATGLNKQIAYKLETTFGTLAGSTGGQLLRRVTANFNLEKEVYESNELRTDFQVSDSRHGVRSAVGSLSGEISPTTYYDFIGSILAKVPVTINSLTAQTLTIAASTVINGVQTYTVGTAPGNYLTGGFKIGDVVRITLSANTNNLNRNLLVIGVTSNSLTVISVNGQALTPETTAATSSTITVFGKKTWAPLTGHTDDSYTIEEWYNDISVSEVYTGMKLNTASISIPASGMATVEFGFMGKDLTQTGASKYFTAPTAQTTKGVTSSANGVLMVGGSPVAIVTGLNININRNMSNAPVMGSNSIAEIFEGRIKVDGDFSAYFADATLRDAFKDETETSLSLVLTSDGTKNSPFVAFTLPRVKVNSFTKDDGEQGLSASCSFQALLNSAGGTGLATEATTISFQDSFF